MDLDVLVIAGCSVLRIATIGPDTRMAALTAQERQIATLAATGLTNKQIGQQLFLSHRTVGALPVQLGRTQVSMHVIRHAE